MIFLIFSFKLMDFRGMAPVARATKMQAKQANQWCKIVDVSHLHPTRDKTQRRMLHTCLGYIIFLAECFKCQNAFVVQMNGFPAFSRALHALADVVHARAARRDHEPRKARRAGFSDQQTMKFT